MKLPQKAIIDKNIPKSKFYEKIGADSSLKNDFIKKVEKINWTYKLSENTINIKKTENIEEIEIFTIYLKEREIPKKILKEIDKAIPYYILFIFIFKEDIAYGISYKEEGGLIDYFFSDWNKKIEFDFSGINLNIVYQNIVKNFIKVESKDKKSFEEIILLERKKKELKKEIKELESKIKKEKQFNKKVELNIELNKKKKELNILN